MHKIPLSAKKISLLAAYWLFPPSLGVELNPTSELQIVFEYQCFICTFGLCKLPQPSTRLRTHKYYYFILNEQTALSNMAFELPTCKSLIQYWLIFFFSLSKLGSDFIFVSSVVNILGLFLSEDFSGELKHSFKFLWV